MLYEPLVSVVIPTYNSSLYIQDALCSVLNQDYQNIEIVIVDDFSPDAIDLKCVITDFFTSHNFESYSLILSDVKLLGGGARNLGVEHSKGEYIAFLDSDDVWLKGKISAQLDCLLKSGNSNTVVFSSLYRGLNLESSIILPSKYYNSSSSIIDFIFWKEEVVQTSTLFMSKKLFNMYKFDAGLIRHQDLDLVINMSSECHFIHLEQPLVFWKQEEFFSTVKKGASFDFCSKFILDRSFIVSDKALSFYVARTLLSTAFKQKRLLDYCYFFIRELNFSNKIQVIKFILLALFNKVIK